jgi:hypothetical protein
MKNWWVVYKVNPEMDTHQYDAYVERHDDDDVIHVYQEEIKGHQSFTISDGVHHLDPPINQPIEPWLPAHVPPCACPRAPRMQGSVPHGPTWLNLARPQQSRKAPPTCSSMND